MAKKDVLDVLSEVRSDPKLIKEFIAQPESTLKKLGVDPSGLTVQKLPPKPVPAAGPAAAEAAVCGSVGCVGCVSVG
jgi:hypothetical protein